MRNLKLLFVAVLVSTFSLATYANNAANPVNPIEDVVFETVSQKLQKQVDKILGEHELDIDDTMSARLTFMVTTHNEIVVLRVVSKDALAESFIKSKLNYKEVKDVEEAKNKTYTMRVKLKPGK